jgi:hypothetical protein
MASTQEELLDNFATLAGNLAPNLNEAIETTQALADSLNEQATDYGGLQIASTDPPAQTGTTGTTSRSSSTSSASDGTSEAMLILESGFGLAPLIGGLLGLFGGGGSTTPPPLVKYAMPSALNIQAAASGQGLSNADYDQTGMPRAYDGTGSPSVDNAVSGPGGGQAETVPAGYQADAALDSAPTSGATGNRAPSPAQITVNVQAMDARSFLDRSADIAAAVRDAMLNLNTINDVVTDL